LVVKAFDAEGVIIKIGGWRTRSAFERYRDCEPQRHCERDSQAAGIREESQAGKGARWSSERRDKVQAGKPFLIPNRKLAMESGARG
jgi:hypothetical protein